MAEEEIVLEEFVDGEAGDLELAHGKVSEGVQNVEKTRNVVPFWKLYRYANCMDVSVILLAILFTVIGGMSYSLTILLFGLVVNEFVDYTVAITLVNENYTSNDYFCNTSAQTNLFDYINSNDPTDMLRSQIITYTYYSFGLALVLFLMTSLSRFLWSFSGFRQAKKMRLDYFKSVLTRHVGWFDLNSSTELPTHLSHGIQTIENGIGRGMSTIIQNLVTFTCCFVVAFIVSWELTAVICTLLPVLFLSAYIIGKVTTIFVAKTQNALAKAGSVAEEVLSSIKTVKAYDGQNKEVERYQFLLKQANQGSYKILFMTGILRGILMLFVQLFHAVGYGYAGYLFTVCSIRAGDGFLVTTEIGIGSFLLAELLPALRNIFASIAAASVVYEVIDQKSDINPDSDTGIFLDSSKGSIQFSDVIFSYPSRPDVQILHGLDLSVKPGQTVALVGPSGCGKSTISKLIPRIYDINGGNISLDGINIQDLKISWLRNQISIVSQEPVLFNVSIAENISFGKEGATMDDIQTAAKTANAHNFISELPDGYDTLVGEGGIQLSGGQKQRVAIARALVRDPKILLLDEATSALDTESEKVVQDALNKAKEGRTTIIIAHRLSTIQTADVIIGIDNGHVVEMGSHNELMKREGLYYQLVMNQTIEESEENEIGRRKKGNITHKLIHQPLSIKASEGVSHTKSYYHSTSNLPQYSDVLQQNTDQETSEDSLLLQKVYNPKLLSVCKEIIALCLDKVHKFFLGFSAFMFILIGVVQAANYVLYRQIIQIFTETDSDTLLTDITFYCILFVVSGCGNAVLAFFGVTSVGICELQLDEKVRQKSFRAMVRQDISWFDRPENSVSVLTHKLSTEASAISQMLNYNAGLSLRSIASVIVTVILAFATVWPIALVVTPAFPLIFLAGYLQVILTKRYAAKRNKLIEDSAKVAIEAVENVYTVATLGIEKRLVRKYEQLLKQPFKYDLKSSAINGVIFGISVATLPFFLSIAYTVGAFVYTSDEDKVYYADYAYILTAILSVLINGETTKRGFEVLPDSQNALLSAYSFFKLLSQQTVVENFRENGITPDEVKADLKMQQVYFQYPSRPGVTVLKALNISITPGHTLALVGPSGSGKSTVVSLIERFYDSTSGSILLDGIELRELNIFWLRRQISLVSQEPVLFNMSIADNIRYGANFREISDEEIMEAAKSANIHEFIQSLPEGYNTNVGFKGTQLSGGQKQRVAIARALVRDPKILLLDEATSALDTESEKVVQDALDKARKGRTTIIIAHRLSTVYNSDSIAVLDKGRVIEQGTHSELMSQQGAYYLMNTVQKQES